MRFGDFVERYAQRVRQMRNRSDSMSFRSRFPVFLWRGDDEGFAFTKMFQHDFQRRSFLKFPFEMRSSFVVILENRNQRFGRSAPHVGCRSFEDDAKWLSARDKVVKHERDTVG